MKILLPTDFSLNAKKAIDYAINCFPKAEFTLLHIIHLHQAGSSLVVDINHELVKANQPKIEKLISDLKQNQPNLKINGKVEIGFFSQTIIEVGDNINADLIVLGTKGSSGLEEVLIGSNAAEVVKNVNKPIIIVPQNSVVKCPQYILLSSDFTSESQNIESDLIDIIREYFNAELDLLHVFSSKDKSDNVNYSHLIEKKEVDIHVISSENIEEAILDYAHEQNYDLITLIPKDRGLIRNLFHHSVTKKLSMHSDIPLLIWK